MNNEPNNYWKPEEQPEPITPAAPQPVATVPPQETAQPMMASSQTPPAPILPATPPQETLSQLEERLQSDPISETIETKGEQVEQFAQETPITWTAQEYVHLDRNGLWYVLFVLVALSFIAVDFFFLKSWTFSALVIVMAVAIVVYIRRPPRSLTYALSGAQGLYIGEKLYHLDDFKSFGIINDAGNNSIMLIPRKRFSPGVSVFFPEDAGEQIVDILGKRLPMEELKLDMIDVVVRKLRL